MTIDEIISGIQEVIDCESVVYQYRIYALEAAITLIKSYQPRLLRLDEIHRGMAVWLECKSYPGIVLLAIGGSSAGGGKNFITEMDVSFAPRDADYNVTWRAWTGKPTKEQMDNEPWNKKEE